MSEFPKLAVKGREEFAMLKSSLLTRYVGLKSAGKNSSQSLVEGQIGFASLKLKEENLIIKAAEEYIKSGAEVDVQSLVAKLAQSQRKSKSEDLVV